MYTVMPPELLWDDDDEHAFPGGDDGTGMSSGGALPRFETRDLHGVPVLVARLSASRYRLERVLSTDPNDYLNPGLTPGTIVTDSGRGAIG